MGRVFLSCFRRFERLQELSQRPVVSRVEGLTHLTPGFTQWVYIFIARWFQQSLLHTANSHQNLATQALAVFHEGAKTVTRKCAILQRYY